MAPCLPAIRPLLILTTFKLVRIVSTSTVVRRKLESNSSMRIVYAGLKSTTPGKSPYQSTSCAIANATPKTHSAQHKRNQSCRLPT